MATSTDIKTAISYLNEFAKVENVNNPRLSMFVFDEVLRSCARGENTNILYSKTNKKSKFIEDKLKEKTGVNSRLTKCKNHKTNYSYS